LKESIQNPRPLYGVLLASPHAKLGRPVRSHRILKEEGVMGISLRWPWGLGRGRQNLHRESPEAKSSNHRVMSEQYIDAVLRDLIIFQISLHLHQQLT
jgi:hypothetical protein